MKDMASAPTQYRWDIRTGSQRASQIPRRSGTGPVPLSAAQRRLWILHQFDRDDPSSNRPLAVRLIGQLDQGALELSLNEILRRHEIMRTVFPEVESEPAQVVIPAGPLYLETKDLRHLPKPEREAQAEQIAVQEAQKVFDLANGPLVRAALLRLGTDEHVLLLLMHHIVFDGWSEGVLLRELKALYESFSGGGKVSPLPDLPIQYADFAVWQDKQLGEGALEKQLSYWKQQLEGLSSLTLPTDYPRTKAPISQGSRQYLLVPLVLAEQLKELSRREHVTLFMTLLAAFQALLSRYTGQEDIAVGVPIAGRTHVETEGLIGCFMNVLVLRTALSGNPSFREALIRVRDMALQAYIHQEVPFEKLVEELRPERLSNRWPLFQTMFNLRNLPTVAVKQAGNLRIEPFPFDSGVIGGFDLSLEVVDRPDGLHCVFKYASDLYREDTIQRMMDHFCMLLEGIVAHPEQQLWSLPLLTESERRQLLVEWNDTRRDYPKGTCIQEMFEAQVQCTPEAVAVICEEKQLTYRELNRRANQLAHYLSRHGVGPEVLVGICMEHSVEMLIGLLGILKAGGAYVPLDPTYPKSRLQFILTDASVRILLTQHALLERLPATPHDKYGTVKRVVCLDTDWNAISQERAENLVNKVRPSNLAYIIYTSGSTGTPKGVMACHRGVCNYLLWRCEYFPLTRQDRLLQRASFNFDDSVWEFFEPLTVGASLIIAESYSHQDVSYLIRLISQYKITAACFVPSMLQTLLDQPNVESCKHLRRVTTGAETLSVELKDRFFKRLTGGLYNGYGTTEATIGSTFWACDRATNPRVVLIGKPIANTEIYLLDSHLNPVPVGVPGEIYIGGDGLARGYLNRPDLTAEKFIPNPFGHEHGARLYRTGDQARYQPDGNIEFLGRIDHQVKIRGFRIELGEIEAVLTQHPGVEEATVNVAESGSYDKRLIAYVVPNSAGSLTIDDVRQFLKKKLPLRMIPSVFMLLERLPRSPNGKIDLQMLPLPNEPGPGTEKAYVAPRNAVEKMLVSLWSDVLGLPQISVEDNFFDLGGHSLLATRLLSRVRATFQTDLSLRALFENPTVAGLAVQIAQVQASKAVPKEMADVIADLESLSDEEAQRLLAQESPKEM